MASIWKTLSRFKDRSFLSKLAWGIFMLLLGVGMFYMIAFILSPWGTFSIYPAAILKIYLGVLALIFVDKVIHSKINTTQAILNNNVSYPLILLGYALIIALVLNAV